MKIVPRTAWTTYQMTAYISDEMKSVASMKYIKEQIQNNLGYLNFSLNCHAHPHHD